MPYCSIEEAWGDNFTNENTNITKEENYSRTYERLPEHSGPPTRLPKKRKSKKKKNKDTIEAYNQTSQSPTESYFNSSDIDNFKNDDENVEIKEEGSEKSLYLDLLRENQELKNMISSLQNQSLDTDNIFDLVLFISSGIFIIFVLDIFVKNIRRF